MSGSGLKRITGSRPCATVGNSLLAKGLIASSAQEVRSFNSRSRIGSPLRTRLQNFLRCHGGLLYPTRDEEDDQDQHDQAGTTRRVVAPAGAVWPGRQGAEQQQNENDEKDGPETCSSSGGLSSQPGREEFVPCSTT